MTQRKHHKKVQEAFVSQDLETMSWSEIKKIDVVGAVHEKDRPFISEAEYALGWKDLETIYRRAIKENVLLEHNKFYLQRADFYTSGRWFLGVEHRRRALDYVVNVATSSKCLVCPNIAGNHIESLISMAAHLPHDCSTKIKLGDYWTFDPKKEIISFSNHSLYGLSYGGQRYIWEKKPISFEDIAVIITKGEDSFPSRD